MRPSTLEPPAVPDLVHAPQRPGALSAAARVRLLSRRGEPLLVAGWLRTVFLHFEIDPGALQRAVPFALDLRSGRAFVSCVAFSLARMRPRLGGRLGEWLFAPIGRSEFLNLRAYVRHGGEPGIYFLAEWLDNSLAVRLGPPVFGLPYRHGRLAYAHDLSTGRLTGEIRAADGTALAYDCLVPGGKAHAPLAGTDAEFLLERYTAFTHWRGLSRLFRVWHPPWPQLAVTATVTDRSLLVRRWPIFADARLVGAHYSPGFEEVWMGRPHRVADEGAGG